MDYHNNARGRSYADNGDCAVTCEEGLDNGDLTYDISPSGNYWE
jgi:hypothetical protein